MQSNKFYDSWLQANALARFMHDLSRTWGQHPKSGADSEAVGDFEDELWLMQNKRGQIHRGVSSRQLLPTRYGFSYL